MLQRDYIMRLVRQFIEALEKLVEEKKKEDGPEFQLKIQSCLLYTSDAADD